MGNDLISREALPICHGDCGALTLEEGWKQLIPACYGCIETTILRSGACMRCDYVEGCKMYAANLKKDWEEIVRRAHMR